MVEKKKSKKPRWPRHAVYLYPPIVDVTKKRQPFQTERVLRVMSKLYPDGTDGISTTVIHRRVVAELKPESKRLGLRDPSLATVARALGRR